MVRFLYDQFHVARELIDIAGLFQLELWRFWGRLRAGLFWVFCRGAVGPI